jgi:hypothetical protein
VKYENTEAMLARLQQAAENDRTPAVESSRAEALYSECLDVAEAFLGHRDCMLTDESEIWHFCVDAEDVARAQRQLGVPIDRDDCVVDVAARLRAKRRGGVA